MSSKTIKVPTPGSKLSSQMPNSPLGVPDVSLLAKYKAMEAILRKVHANGCWITRLEAEQLFRLHGSAPIRWSPGLQVGHDLECARTDLLAKLKATIALIEDYDKVTAPTTGYSDEYARTPITSWILTLPLQEEFEEDQELGLTSDTKLIELQETAWEVETRIEVYLIWVDAVNSSAIPFEHAMIWHISKTLHLHMMRILRDKKGESRKQWLDARKLSELLDCLPDHPYIKDHNIIGDKKREATEADAPVETRSKLQLRNNPKLAKMLLSPASRKRMENQQNESLEISLGRQQRKLEACTKLASGAGVAWFHMENPNTKADPSKIEDELRASLIEFVNVCYVGKR